MDGLLWVAALATIGPLGAAKLCGGQDTACILQCAIPLLSYGRVGLRPVMQVVKPRGKNGGVKHRAALASWPTRTSCPVAGRMARTTCS